MVKIKVTSNLLGGPNIGAMIQGTVAWDMEAGFLVVLPLVVANAFHAAIVTELASESDRLQDLLKGPAPVVPNGPCA